MEKLFYKIYFPDRFNLSLKPEEIAGKSSICFDRKFS